MILVDAVAPDPVEAELVLDVHRVGGRLVDRSGRPPVAGAVPLPDAPADLGAVRPSGVRLVDRGGNATDRWVGRLHGGHEIGGEGGYAAATRYGGGDKSDAQESILLCQR